MSYVTSVTLYKFSELSESVQNNLIGGFEAPDYWDEPIIEGIFEEARNLGIENFEFLYSGFGSQGDGCSFTGTLSVLSSENIYKEKINRDGFSNDNEFEVVFSRKSYPHYVHEKMVHSQIMPLDEDLYDYECTSTIENAYNDWKDELCYEWYQRLGTHYNDLIDSENIKNHYEEMGAVFLEDGRVLNISYSE